MAQALGNDLMIGHHALLVVNFDSHLVPLNFDGVLVGGELFSLSANLKAEMTVALARQFKVTAKLGADFAVTLVEFGELLLERAKRFLFLAIGLSNGFLNNGRVLAKLANQIDHDLFQRAGRNAAEWTFRMLSVPVNASTLVIEVLLAVGVLLAAGMRNQAIAAMPAMSKALERGLMLVALAFGRRFNTELIQGFIGLFPKLGRDNSLVLAGVFFAAMLNDALVNGVADDLLDFVGAKTLAADVPFAVAGLIDPLTGAGPLVVDLLSDQRCVGILGGKRIDAFD